LSGVGEDDAGVVRVYGQWQTEEWTPPALSEEGLVPRSAFGHVEVWDGDGRFVPRGCTWVQGHRGLGGVAARLGIDAAPAMTGFEPGAAGRRVPALNGWVVPTHAAAVLLEAWEGVEAAKAERDAAARSARAVGRWEALVRGALVQRRLRATYAAYGLGGVAAADVATTAPAASDRPTLAHTATASAAAKRPRSPSSSSSSSSSSPSAAPGMPRRRLRRRGRPSSSSSSSSSTSSPATSLS
jgi:hypothetical protein